MRAQEASTSATAAAPAAAGGLEGVVVADTALSRVEGEQGRLLVAGHDVEELAGHAPFEAVCGLLWTGALPDLASLRRLRRALGAARVEAFARLDHLGDALEAPHPMDALRAGLAHWPSCEAGDEAARCRLAGALPVLAAAWAWRQRGGSPVPPEPSLPHAADALRMLTGAPAPAARVMALDTYLATVAEHGMNASTFAARVVASTGSDAVSCLVAALGALKGPLHGGAPGPVLDMLEAIGAPERARSWLEAELDAGRRLMGFGHRVYRVRDPRAAIFERAALALARSGAAGERLALARAVEARAVELLRERHPGRRLEANVEFYTAVLLDAVGLPRALFTPVFAVGRVAGWLAHVDEQARSGRIIRPSSRYVGPLPSAAA